MVNFENLVCNENLRKLNLFIDLTIFYLMEKLLNTPLQLKSICYIKESLISSAKPLRPPEASIHGYVEKSTKYDCGWVELQLP